MTLRRRVILALLGLGLVTLAVNLVATMLTAKYLRDRTDESLRKSPLAQPSLTRALPLVPSSCASADVLPDVTTFMANDAGQAQVFCSTRLSPVVNFAALKLAPGEYTHPFDAEDAKGTSYRVMVRRVEKGYLGIGFSLEPARLTVRNVGIVHLFAVLVSIGGTGLVASWLLRRGVKPIDAVVATADRITKGQRDERVEVRGHSNDEIARLGRGLNTMLDELSNSEAKLRRFVQDASHELRTPLTSIRGYAELYRSGALPDRLAVDDAMRRVHAESIRLSALVDDLLELATHDQAPSLTRAPVHLREVVELAAADARVVSPGHPITIACDGTEVVNGNAQVLHQVFTNLFANVRAHTGPGTPTQVTIYSNGPVVEVSVRDQGPGIPAELLDSVFDRFVRSDASRHRGPGEGGAGLGLSIVRALVEGLHGTVRARNYRGGGAEMIMTFETAQLPALVAGSP